MIGVILAGGRSQRMGSDKAMVEVANRPMAEWVAAALSRVCDEVVVAGRRRPLAGLPAIPDPRSSHRGPLAGLVAAWQHYPGHAVALVAVDQPWLRSETVRQLVALGRDLAVAPVEGGVRQTTCALYPSSLAEVAATELAGGGSLQSLLDVASFVPVVDWQEWGEDGRSWYSVDTPAALAGGLERFGPPGGE